MDKKALLQKKFQQSGGANFADWAVEKGIIDKRTAQGSYGAYGGGGTQQSYIRQIESAVNAVDLNKFGLGTPEALSAFEKEADWSPAVMEYNRKAALGIKQDVIGGRGETASTPLITSSNGASPEQLISTIQNQNVSQGTPAFTLTGGQNLKSGSSGTNVSQLQTLLNKGGAGLKIDGKYGQLTTAAVKKFQSENGLVADGVVGPKTVAALAKLGQTQSNAGTTTGGASGVSGGATGGTTGTAGVGTSGTARTDKEKRDAELARITALTPPTVPTTSAEETAAITAKNDLSNQIADVTNQKALLTEEMRQYTETSGRELSMGGYSGGLSEKSKELQFKMDSLNIKETLLTTKLNNQISTINEIRDTTQTNYTNALNLYNSQFSNALKLYEILDKDQDEIVTNAKANIDVLANTYKAQIQAGTITDLTPLQQSKLNELEAQAGYPIGATLASLQTLKPNETVQQKGVDDKGNYYEVIKRADGSLYTRGISNVAEKKESIPTPSSFFNIETNQPMTPFEAARSIVEKNPTASENELVNAIRENVGLSVGDAQRIAREGIETRPAPAPATQESIKQQVVNILTPQKDLFSRSEAKTQAEIQLKSALGLKEEQTLPKTFKEAIEDALVTVYGRTLGQKLIPGGR